MKYFYLIVFFILITSCTPTLKKFIQKEKVKVLSYDTITRERDFIVYVEDSIELEIIKKFPNIKERFKNFEFDMEIKLLITSDIRKDILWYDYEITDYLENMKIEEDDYCNEICLYLYSIINPKFYPTLFYNRPKKSSIGYRTHKIPARVSLLIEFYEGEINVQYAL